MDLIEKNYSEQGMGFCSYGCRNQEERYRNCMSDRDKYIEQKNEQDEALKDFEKSPERIEFNQLKNTLAERLVQAKELEIELDRERLRTEQYRQNPALNLEGMGIWSCFKCKWDKKEAENMCKQKEKAHKEVSGMEKVENLKSRILKDTQDFRDQLKDVNDKIAELKKQITAEKQLQESIRNAEKLRLESEKTLATATIDDKTADGFNINKILYIALGVLVVKVLFFPNTSKGSKNVIKVKA